MTGYGITKPFSCTKDENLFKFNPMSLLGIDRRWWVSLNISIGIYMSTLDASIVNISLPTIIQSLNTTIKAVAWVVIAYLIIITGCLLLMGRLADLFGQKKIYLFGFLTFTIGSFLCGISPTINFLILSRVIQGLGASATMGIGPAIITGAFPEKERGQALGIMGSVVSAGFLSGPLIGGFMIEHLGWRSVFFVNLPVGALGIYLSIKVLENVRSEDKVQIDFLGFSLVFSFITSFLLFINRVGKGLYPLHLIWLGISLLSLTLFLIVEIKTTSPLVDLRLFKRRLFTSSLVTSFLSFWIGGAHTFLIPFFLQDILRFSPSKVGMMVFPVSLTLMVMAPLGGRFSDRIGIRIPTTTGLIIISLTIFSFTLLGKGAGDHDILWRQILLGVGIGLFNPANNSAIIGSLPKEMSGLASSFLALARNLGMVVGVAFSEMILMMRSTHNLVEQITLEGFHDVWRVVVIFGLAAILISLMRNK